MLNVRRLTTMQREERVLTEDKAGEEEKIRHQLEEEIKTQERRELEIEEERGGRENERRGRMGDREEDG